MNSLITGFAVALITNSAIIVNWTDVHNYIQEPIKNCFISNTTFNNELSYWYKKDEIFTFPDQTANTFKRDKNLNNLFLNIPEKYSRYIFNGIGAIFFELGCNKSYFPAFLKYGLVKNATIQKSLLILNSNKPLESNNYTLNTLYRVGFELGHNILNLFWKPKAEMKNLVDNFVFKNFEGFFVIGLQLRYRYLDWKDTDIFIDCAKNIEKTVNRSVKWYISTDEESNLNKIKNSYSGKVLHGTGYISDVYFDKGGYFRALFDLEVLSRCDELIITGGSTFGFLAAMMVDVYPWFVNGQKNSVQCDKFLFSNPSLTPLNFSVF